jgi:hypothetical protein
MKQRSRFVFPILLLIIMGLSAFLYPALADDVDSFIYLPLISKSLPPTPTPTPTPLPSPTPAPPPSGHNVVCQQFDADELCAWVSNGSPARYSNVTVYGRFYQNGVPVSGLGMSTTWYYRTTTVGCTGMTNAAGIASCTRSIGQASLGYQVNIVVVIGGRQVTTWFTPQ